MPRFLKSGRRRQTEHRFDTTYNSFWWPEHLEYMYDMVLKGIYYASGMKFTKDELFEIFEKSNQTERATIAMRGIRHEDDQPNHKCLNESCPGEHPVGPVPRPPINSKKYNKILDAHYEVRGWEKTTGIPKTSHLKKLGLGDVAEKMKKALA